jgi:hypothetical protein
MSCPHSKVKCLNEFEFIRKYRCLDCGAVMMCACDERIGRGHLSHQLDRGVVLETQERVPVTTGFQANICRECRGLPPEAHPVSSIPGRTSKIKRYYWREIAFREMELFDAWKQTPEGQVHSRNSWFGIPGLADQALAEIKHLHAIRPKYVFKNMSQQQVLEKCNVDILDLKAQYVPAIEGRAQVVMDGLTLGVEAFARRNLEALGYTTMICESRPFHVLFATLLGALITDPADPKLRLIGMADRTAPANQQRPLLWKRPEDFGTAGYGQRREHEISTYLNDVLPETTVRLLDLFDGSLQASWFLRTYLWADEPSAIDTARTLLSLMTPATIKSILRYLVDSYWANYVGWPDLVVYGKAEWFFAEVKSSHDKLSDDQKHWIEQNHARLKLPFKLIKIHRAVVQEGK